MSVKMGGIEKMWRCRGRNDGGMETCSLLTNLMLVMIRLFSPCDGRLFALHSDRLSLYKYLNARHWIYDRTVHHNTHDKMADPTELEILYCMIGAMEICLLRTDILQQLDYVYVALHGAAHNETTSNNITALVAGLPILCGHCELWLETYSERLLEPQRPAQPLRGCQSELPPHPRTHERSRSFVSSDLDFSKVIHLPQVQTQPVSLQYMINTSTDTLRAMKRSGQLPNF
jgi:hypothetical protein